MARIPWRGEDPSIAKGRLGEGVQSKRWMLLQAAVHCQYNRHILSYRKEAIGRVVVPSLLPWERRCVALQLRRIPKPSWRSLTESTLASLWWFLNHRSFFLRQLPWYTYIHTYIHTYILYIYNNYSQFITSSDYNRTSTLVDLLSIKYTYINVYIHTYIQYAPKKTHDAIFEYFLPTLSM